MDTQHDWDSGSDSEWEYKDEIDFERNGTKYLDFAGEAIRKI